MSDDVDGTDDVHVRAPVQLLEVVSDLAGQLITLHETSQGLRDHPALRRLYPVVHDDVDVAAELDALVVSDLAEKRITELRTLQEALSNAVEDHEVAASTDDPEAPGWCELVLHDDEAPIILRAAQSLSITLAVAVDPKVFDADGADLETEQIHDLSATAQPGIAAHLLDALRELQELMLAQIDPETQHHHRHDDGPSDS